MSVGPKIGGHYYDSSSGWSLLWLVQFSRSVMSDSLQLHELQNARLPCPSPTPRACSNSTLLSHWVQSTISSCRPLLLPSIFPRIRVFSSESVLPIFGGQSIAALVSALVFPMNIQDLFPLGWTSWISLKSKGLSRVFSSIPIQKHQFFGAQPSL